MFCFVYFARNVADLRVEGLNLCQKWIVAAVWCCRRFVEFGRMKIAVKREKNYLHNCARENDRLRQQKRFIFWLLYK